MLVSSGTNMKALWLKQKFSKCISGSVVSETPKGKLEMQMPTLYLLNHRP